MREKCCLFQTTAEALTHSRVLKLGALVRALEHSAWPLAPPSGAQRARVPQRPSGWRRPGH